jgi:hypothetical protein
MIPFDEAELGYIARLDAAADVDMLRTELPSLHEGCLRMLELGTLLLQMCAAGPLLLSPPALEFCLASHHLVYISFFAVHALCPLLPACALVVLPSCPDIAESV